MKISKKGFTEKKESNTEKGRKFEGEVATLYRILGYWVERDITICGKQTDMICILNVRGGPKVKLYVDCKDYKSPINSETVRKFIADYRSIPPSKGFTGAVLVTKKSATRRARDAVSANKDCRIITYTELFDELLNVSSALESYISNYERREIHMSYLPLKCIQKNNISVDLTLESPKDAVASINDWIKSRRSLYVIFGDFGTGKTTTLERLKYEISIDLKNNESKLIPIYIPLRDFESVGSIEKFIEIQLRNELDINITYFNFLNFLGNGKFLLMLDGFDEMGQRIDKEKRKENFMQLLPILTVSPKSIISCRPSYFLSDKEIDNVFSDFTQFYTPPLLRSMTASIKSDYFDFLNSVNEWTTRDIRRKNNSYDIQFSNLCEFTEDDINFYIDEFVKRHTNNLHNTLFNLKERIENTYDLKDLVKRPILLNLIVSTLPSIPVHKEASPSLVYSEYTNAWMKHDYSKGRVRQLIPFAQKRKFMHTLAWQMYCKDVMWMNYSDLKPHIDSFFRKYEFSDFLATDIQACSFLERDRVGNFRFSHKSFMEYFCAEYLYNQFRNGNLSKCITTKLAEEICYFLGDIIRSRYSLSRSFDSMLVNTFNSPPKTALKAFEDSILYIFSKGRTTIKGLRIFFRNIENFCFFKNGISIFLKKTQMNEVMFEKCKLIRSFFNHIEGGNINFKQCSGKDLVFSDIKHSRKQAGSPKKKAANSTITINACNFSNFSVKNESSISIKNSDINYVSLIPSKDFFNISYCSIKNGNINRALIQINNSKIHKCLISDVSDMTARERRETLQKMWSNPKAEKVNRWNSVEFSKCLFLWCDFTSMNLNSAYFEECSFIGCRFLDREQIEHLILKNFKKCKFALTTKFYERDDEIKNLNSRIYELKKNISMRINDTTLIDKELKPLQLELAKFESIKKKKYSIIGYKKFLNHLMSINKIDDLPRRKETLLFNSDIRNSNTTLTINNIMAALRINDIDSLK